MKERNEFLEMDGLYWESETHEWFHDKSSTQYAQKEDVHGISLPNIYCFVTRDKETGEYMRVMMDKDAQSVIYDTTKLEDMGAHIDIMKVAKHYNKDEEADKKNEK